MVNPLTFEETTWGEKPPPLHFFSAVPWLFLRHWFPESKRLWMYCECIVMVCPAACPIPSDKFLQFRAPTLWSKTRFMRDKDIAYHSEIIPFYFSRLCDVYLKSLFGSAGWLSVMPLLVFICCLRNMWMHHPLLVLWECSNAWRFHVQLWNTYTVPFAA